MNVVTRTAAALVSRNRTRWLERRATDGAFLGITPGSAVRCWEVLDGAAVVATAALRMGDQLLVSQAPLDAIDALAPVLAEHDIPGWFAPAAVSERLAARLGEERYRVAKRVLHHRLDAVGPVPTAPGAIRRAVPADTTMLAGMLDALQNEILTLRPVDPRETIDAAIARGTLWVWEDGGVVAMAELSAAVDAYLDHVYVPPAHRRHGYAAALVGELARCAVARGGGVRLSTDRDNDAANALYARLGVEVLCEMHNVRRAS